MKPATAQQVAAVKKLLGEHNLIPHWERKVVARILKDGGFHGKGTDNLTSDEAEHLQKVLASKQQVDDLCKVLREEICA